MTTHDADRFFAALVWARVRPYLLVIVQDAIISAVIWIGLWFFHLVTELFPMKTKTAEFLQYLHAAGTAGVFGLFIILTVMHILELREAEHEN